MKKKLFISFFGWLVCVMILYPQVGPIKPDSSHIIGGHDSLRLLPKASEHSSELELDPELDPELELDPDPDINLHLDLEHSLEDDTSEIDSLLQLPSISIWRIDPRSGDRLPAVSDTLMHNYQHTTLPDGASVVMGMPAPLGAPAISKIFIDRPEIEHFIFNNSYNHYLKTPEKLIFVNSRVPYSRLDYQRSGSQQSREERFGSRFAMNFGKSLNIGFDVDIINSRGFYNSEAVKHNNFTFFANYLSDRFESHAFMNLGKIRNFENGGITDETFITDPESIKQSFTTRDIPVKFSKTWNSLGNNYFFLSGRYNLGYNDSSGDSLQIDSEKFIPVASLGFSSEYRDQFRRFLSYDTAFVNVDGVQVQNIDRHYVNRFYNEAVDDSIHFASFKNRVSLSLREGFKSWVKFGLTAFLEYDLRSYSMRDTVGTGRMQHRESAVSIGGMLNKQQGENLLFNFALDLGLLGVNLGELRAMGDIETRFDIAGKRTSLSAEAYIKNLKPKYLENSYHSKYFSWNNSFGDIRRVYLGGKLTVPFTNTTISAGVENLQNFIYLDQNKSIAQESDNIQVLTAAIDQNIHLGIFRWDNQFVYQTSSNPEVIPLPDLSFYSNIYLQFKVVNELTTQLGLDAHYHTKYFAQGYEPALLQFYNQQETEIGNYPISTIYLNMHLKQTRFFLMFYNVASKLIKPTEYFSLPGYPVNPFLFKVGVSVNLHD